MTTKAPDVRALEDQTAHLELMLIEQFIRARGYDPANLGELSTDEREHLRPISNHAPDDSPPIVWISYNSA